MPDDWETLTSLIATKGYSQDDVFTLLRLTHEWRDALKTLGFNEPDSYCIIHNLRARWWGQRRKLLLDTPISTPPPQDQPGPSET